MAAAPLYIGLMSGTSLDGVDGVLTASDRSPVTAYLPFPEALRAELFALQTAGSDEIHREALAANQLTQLYANCVQRLLSQSGLAADAVRAIGVHGQTIRHQPALGYTRQINNPALLAELTGIAVVADFRSRDIAAGGQGAPLVPAYHQAVFSSPSATRVVANIGGISNISILRPPHQVSGFDTGPGNLLMDAWAQRHLGQPYDRNGEWAASGTVLGGLLADFMSEAYLKLAPPKSTGRDLFHTEWLSNKLQAYQQARAEDVQATLAAFTAGTLANAIGRYAPEAQAVYVCGGGALNAELMRLLKASLNAQASSERSPSVDSTEVLGILPMQVEALAFAWLAAQFCERQAGNLPAVTGARGPRILGALYPV